MDSFQLTIVSPEGVLYNDTVHEVSVPTEEGEITILLHHIPLFSKLSEGEIKILKDKKETFVALIGGFLEVNTNSVTIISDYALRAENIDKARAEEAKLRAEEAMKDKLEYEDQMSVEKDFQKAIFELKIADKMRKRTRQ